MRGRTNAGEGIALNATAVNKTVASGQITAGDFVQYYTENSILEQPVLNRLVGIMGEYIITTDARDSYSGSGLRLFKNNSQIDSYTDFPVYDAYTSEDFIVFSSNNLLGVLTIVNDRFVLVDTLETNFSYRKIAFGGGKVCAIHNGSTGSGATLRAAVCDISISGQLDNLQEQTVSGPSIYYTPLRIDYNGSDFYMAEGVSSSTSYTYLWKLSIDNNNAITPTRINSGVRPFSNRLYRNGNLVIYSGWVSSYSPKYRMCLDYLSSGNEVEISLDETPSNISGGMFYTVDDYSVKLYSFDEQNASISLIDTVTISQQLQSSSNGIALLNNGKALCKLYSGNDLVKMEIVNEEYIQEITNPDYVVPFSQYGHPIGIAKTNGNANDVIPIYIPTPST